MLVRTSVREEVYGGGSSGFWRRGRGAIHAPTIFATVIWKGLARSADGVLEFYRTLGRSLSLALAATCGAAFPERAASSSRHKSYNAEEVHCRKISTLRVKQGLTQDVLTADLAHVRRLAPGLDRAGRLEQLGEGFAFRSPKELFISLIF